MSKSAFFQKLLGKKRSKPNAAWQNRSRSLRLESLEDRSLLSVSPAIFQAIQEAYPEFNLGTYESTTSVEIDASGLDRQTLLDAIPGGDGDALLVVRVSPDDVPLKLDANLQIDRNSGKLAIVAIGTDDSVGADAPAFVVDGDKRYQTLRCSGTISVGNAKFVNGDGDYGAGICVDDGALTFSQGEVSDAWGYVGGGIYVEQGATANLKGIDVLRNSSQDGAGIYLAQYATANLEDVVISNNEAAGDGGGMYVEYNATANLKNVALSTNRAEAGTGGGIAGLGAIELLDVQIVGNEANGAGGLHNVGAIDARNATISQNVGEVGAVYNSGIFNAVNLLVSANVGNTSGGVYNDRVAVATLTNATIAGNAATAGNYCAGGVYSETTNFSLRNSIICQNWVAQGGQEKYPNFYGDLSEDSGNNLVDGDSGDAPYFEEGPDFASYGVLNNLDTMNLRLGKNSRAINAGNNALVDGVATDLDGNDRIADGTVDLGAYETRALYLDAPKLRFLSIDEKAFSLAWLDLNAQSFGYSFEYRVQDGEWIVVETQEVALVVEADVANCVDGYEFRVKALGDGEDWNDSEYATLFGKWGDVLVAPEGSESTPKLRIKDAATDMLSFVWTNENADRYQLEFRVLDADGDGVSDGASWRQFNPTANRTYATGFKYDGEYEFRVKSLGAHPYYDSSYSDVVVGRAGVVPEELPEGVLEAPKLSVEKEGEDALTVRWEADDDAICRLEYRKIEDPVLIRGGAEWSVVESSETTLTLSGLQRGDMYEFRAQAFRINPKDELYDPYYDSSYSPIVTAKVGSPELEAPKLRVVDASGGAIKLLWTANAEEKFDKYQVEFRSGADEDGDGKIDVLPWQWSKFSPTSKTTLATGAKADRVYEFRVKALSASVDDVLDSAYSTIATVKIGGEFAVPDDVLQTPSLRVADASDGNISLVWKDATSPDASFAASYRIEYKPNGAKNWSKFGEVSGTTTFSKAVADGVEYQFRVQTLAVGSDPYYNSLYSNVATGELDKTPDVPKNEGVLASPRLFVVGSSESSLTVEWTPVDAAEGYRLEYRREGADSWDVAESAASETSLALNDLHFGDQYELRIQALGSEAYCHSLYSSVATARVGQELAVPNLRVADASDGAFQLVWLAVEGADKYQVEFRSGADADGDGKIDAQTAPWYKFSPTVKTTLATGAKADRVYEFRVKAFGSGEDGDVLESDYSKTATARIGVKPEVPREVLAAPTLTVDLDAESNVGTFSWNDVGAERYQLEYLQVHPDNGKIWRTIPVYKTTYRAGFRYPVEKFRVKAFGTETYYDSLYSDEFVVELPEVVSPNAADKFFAELADEDDDFFF